MAYEFPRGFKPMHKLSGHDQKLWIMKGAFDILSSIYKDEGYGEGNFLGKNAVFVNDKDGRVMVGFWGLGELFRKYEVGPWKGMEEPDKGADIHNLAVCFTKGIQELKLPAAGKYLEDTACNDHESLNGLKSEISQKRAFHREEDIVYLDFSETKGKGKDLIEVLIADLNRRCRLQPVEDKILRLVGEHYLCLCKKLPQRYQVETIGKTDHFNYDEKCTRKHYVKYESCKSSEESYSWSTVQKEVGYAARNMGILPKVSLKHLEKSKFQKPYMHFWKGDKGLYFLLNEDFHKGKLAEDIDKLRKKAKYLLEIVPELSAKPDGTESLVEVGKLVDFGHWVSMALDSKEIPKGSQLQVGETTLKAGDFKIFEFRKKIYLAVEEARLTDIDETEEVVFDKKETIGVCGKPMHKYVVRTLPNKDCNEKFIPEADATLVENIEMEKISYKHQIDATNKMKAMGFQNNNISEIIAGTKEPKFFGAQIKDEDVRKMEFFNKQLDETQKKAVALALSTEGMCLIQGPPGTGKTTVIAEIVMQLCSRYRGARRILVCSQTHAAVVNAIERLEKQTSRTMKIVRLLSSKNNQKNDFSIDGWFDRLFPNRETKARSKSENLQNVRARWKQWCRKARQSKWDKLAGVDEISVYFPVRKDGDTEKHIGPKEAFLRNANVYGATCVHCASGKYKDIYGEKGFEYIIMDEAAKATPSESLVPFQFAEKVVLVGDHKQLPPYSDDAIDEDLKEEKEKEGYDGKDRESLFERFIGEAKWKDCSIMLENQRRMNKEIGDLISKFFYDNKLKTPPDKIKAEEEEQPVLKSGRSLVFIDTSHLEKRGQEKADDGKSSINQCNAGIIVNEVLPWLEKLLEKTREKKEVAIISGYKGQVELLNGKIKNKRFKYIKMEKEAATVDSFQGREAPIVIYDTVCSGHGLSKFMRNENRLNVALSRAQKLLIIIGDKASLSKPDDEPSPLREIAKYLDEKGLCFKDLKEAAEK